MKSGKAELIIHQKLTSPLGLIRELSIWRVKSSEQYPDGARYRLALVDPANGTVHLMYDNHWPKGHHVHSEGREQRYSFSTVADLIREFREKSDAIERKLK